MASGCVKNGNSLEKWQQQPVILTPVEILLFHHSFQDTQCVARNREDGKLKADGHQSGRKDIIQDSLEIEQLKEEIQRLKEENLKMVRGKSRVIKRLKEWLENDNQKTETMKP